MSGPRSPTAQRFEFFTDGVFAIVVTIMAIELKIPEIGEHLVGEWDFAFLAPELPKLLSYALGFFIIATGWVGHLLMSRELVRTNVQLISANLVYLFLASLLPAATAFVGDHPALPQAVMLWSAVGAAALIWGNYVLLPAAEGAGMPKFPWARRRNICASVVALAAVAAPIVSIHASWGLIFVAYALYWIPIRQASRLFGSQALSGAERSTDIVVTIDGEMPIPAKAIARRQSKKARTGKKTRAADA